jgi:predicted GNAT superfamily acetyltransferase
MERSEESTGRAATPMNPGPHGSIEIHPLFDLRHFARCVELQLEVWGYDDGDVIPRRMFLVAQRIGGQVFGAFDGDIMIGFAMSLPGYRSGQSYLHSHMLAVLPTYRNASIGRRLKLAQREDALAKGFDLMEWTFDPLEIKNAHLNIARLGAIARRYQPDFYGSSTSPLQGGLPTDRLYAEWWLRSPSVASVLRGEPQPQQILERVTVPHTIYQWKQDPQHRSRAQAVQSANRESLQSAFDRGLAVIGYERDADGNGSYLLGPWVQPQPFHNLSQTPSR